MKKPKAFEVISRTGLRHNSAYDADEMDAWLDSISVEKILIAMADHHSGNHAEALKIARAIRELLRGEK